MKKRKLNKKRIILVGGILFLVFISLWFVIKLIDDKEFSLNFKSRIETLNNFETNALRRGWIQVQGTNIDLPILSSTDYLTSKDDYKYSWLSGNYRTGQNRKVIIGHNVLNVSSKPTKNMTNLEDFEGLMAFAYYDFAEENLYIQYTDFNTKEEKLYLIYAIGFYDYDYDRGEGFSDKSEIEDYIKKVRNNSIYDYDIEVDSNDTIITVKTCTRFFGNSEKQQFVIDAREIRDNEEVVRYKVTKSKVFKDLDL